MGSNDYQYKITRASVLKNTLFAVKLITLGNQIQVQPAINFSSLTKIYFFTNSNMANGFTTFLQFASIQRIIERVSSELRSLNVN